MTTYYYPHNNTCLDCPPHSSQLVRGAMSCTCNGGYEQSGEANELVCKICGAGYYSKAGDPQCTKCPAGYAGGEGSSSCTICPVGYYSTEGSSVCSECGYGNIAVTPGQADCTACPLGSYSDTTTGSRCTLCPMGSYADREGAESCKTCKAGEITPALGAISDLMCVNPTPNFTIGIITLFFVLVTIYVYLLQGRLQKIAFERRVLFVEPLAKTCHKINQRLLRDISAQQRKRHTLASWIRVVLFLVASLFFLFIFTCFYYLYVFYKAFYKAMFLWRGFSIYIAVPPFVNTLEHALDDIAISFNLPIDLVGYIFYPMVFLYNFFSQFSLDLSTISVKCDGAKAPAELMINFFIMGLVVSIMLSGYQYLWVIVFPSLNQTFLNVNFMKGNLLYNRNAYLCFLGLVAMSMNPFEALMRYLMTLMTLTDFVSDNGAHGITPACNDIAGMRNIDSFLGYTSSLIAWWLVMPFIYIMSEILVPKTILREGEVLRTEDDKILPKLNSIVPEGSAANQPRSIPNTTNVRDRRGARGRPAVAIAPLNVDELKKKHRKTTVLMVANRYRRLFGKTLSAIISVDIVIITSASMWLHFLSTKHGIQDVHKFEVDTDDDSSSDEELQKQELEKKKSRWISIDWNKVLDRLMLTAHAKKFELDQKRIQQAKEKDEAHHYAKFSTYNELCVFVERELQHKKKFPWIFAAIVAWTGIGHPFTRVGRIHWRFVGRKYYIFLSACLGVWTDEIVDSYGLEETAETIFIDDDTESNYTRLLYISVGIRAILFQVLQILTFVSVVVGALSGTPLFVFSKRLHKCLPKLLAWNCWEIAVEKEITVQGNLNIEVTQWVVTLRAIAIFFGESRLLAFISNVLGVSLSFLVLIYSKKTRPLIILILILIFPFAFTRSFEFVIFAGKSLDLYDHDFVEFFRLIFWIFSFGYGRCRPFRIVHNGHDDAQVLPEDVKINRETHEVAIRGHIVSKRPHIKGDNSKSSSRTADDGKIPEELFSEIELSPDDDSDNIHQGGYLSKIVHGRQSFISAEEVYGTDFWYEFTSSDEEDSNGQRITNDADSLLDIPLHQPFLSHTKNDDCDCDESSRETVDSSVISRGASPTAEENGDNADDISFSIVSFNSLHSDEIQEKSLSFDLSEDVENSDHSAWTNSSPAKTSVDGDYYQETNGVVEVEQEQEGLTEEEPKLEGDEKKFNEVQKKPHEDEDELIIVVDEDGNIIKQGKYSEVVDLDDDEYEYEELPGDDSKEFSVLPDNSIDDMSGYTLSSDECQS